MKTRIIIGLLAAILVGTTLVTFYNYASSPTDENIFTDSPGKFMFAAPLDVPSDSISIQEGDILVEINGSHGKGKTLAEVRQMLAQAFRDSAFALVGVNQSKKMVYRRYSVRTELLRSVPLEPIDSTALVV
ncbi:hypothetical protein EHM92_03465, partial [bacterium]